jgi:hypothetical protein
VLNFFLFQYSSSDCTIITGMATSQQAKSADPHSPVYGNMSCVNNGPYTSGDTALLNTTGVHYPEFAEGSNPLIFRVIATINVCG